MLLLFRIRLRRITAAQTTELPIIPTINTTMKIRRSVHRMGGGSMKLPFSVGSTTVSFFCVHVEPQIQLLMLELFNLIQFIFLRLSCRRIHPDELTSEIALGIRNLTSLRKCPTLLKQWCHALNFSLSVQFLMAITYSSIYLKLKTCF